MNETSVVSVRVSTASIREAGAGPSPSAALYDIKVRPIPFVAARNMIEKHHYLHSMPGGTLLAFGALVNEKLLGAITFGCGPANAHRLVDGVTPDKCMTLTRLWLSDDLPNNSESRIIGICLRAFASFEEEYQYQVHCFICGPNRRTRWHNLPGNRLGLYRSKRSHA